MHSLMLNLFICITMIFKVSANGKLYIGFLNFSNPTNRKYDGSCCDSQNNFGGQCEDYCDLLFNVTVHGLDTGFPNTKQLSPIPIPQSTTSFKNISHPIEFDFEKWPGNITVVIDVYDFDNGPSPECVDHFIFVFNPTGPSAFFCQMIGNGTRDRDATSLKILLRYGCNEPFYANDCFKDCLNCPPATGSTSETGSTSLVTGWNIIISSPHPVSNGYCGNIIATHSGQNPSLKVDTTTSDTHDATTPITTISNVSPSSKVTSSISTPTSFTKDTNNNGISLATKTSKLIDTPTTNKIDQSKITKQSQLTENGLTTGASTRHPDKQDVRTIVDETETNGNNQNPNQIDNSHLSTEHTESSTNPPAIPDNNDDGAMDYWPGIVGGVLGALVLLAAISFVVYYKKRKDALIRQDIYNVNPKKWALEPPEENGTSGKSEIALETEPV